MIDGKLVLSFGVVALLLVSTGAAIVGAAAAAPLGATVRGTALGPATGPEQYGVTFQATGLPAGTLWSVDLNGTTTYSTNTSDVFEVPNGSYPFVVHAVSPAGPVPSPGSGTVAVDGAATSQNISFSLPAGRYAVTFEISGLPVNTTWTVEFGLNFSNGSYSTGMSSGPAVSFVGGNGGYEFDIYLSVANASASPASGHLSVAGSDVTVFVRVVVSYRVAFEELGLPAGTLWSVDLNGSTAGSASAYANFSDPNGSYPFSAVAYAAYTPAPANGTLVVDGSSVRELIRFAPNVTTYPVTFTENGLPAGTLWWANVTGEAPLSSTSPTLSTPLPNGSYTFSADAANASYAASGGSLEVAGAALGVAVAFHRTAFNVTFAESGLPAGAAWYVNVTGGPALNSTGTTMVAVLPNGSYLYVATTVASNLSAPSGSFEVEGAAVDVGVSFSAGAFPVTFHETGLPAGTRWYANVSGEPPLEGSGTELSTTLPNGNYTYAVASGNATYAAAGGDFSVHDAGVSESVTFAALTYAVTFRESGLAGGTDWSVTLNGTSNHSSGSTIGFRAANGTWPFAVSTVLGYRGNVTGGEVRFDGGPAEVNVTFAPSPVSEYPVTFSERGLPAGRSWSVSLNGTLGASAAAAITFEVANATRLAFEVPAVGGYAPNVSSGWVSVDGRAVAVAVAFEANASHGPAAFLGLPGGTGYAVVGGLAAAAAGAAAFLLLRRARRRNPGGASQGTGEAEPPKPGASG